MSHNWGFVIAGYSITAVSIGAYFAWIRLRAKALRRTLGEDDGD